MRIYIISDTHLEFFYPGEYIKFLDTIAPKATKDDVLVIAGDLSLSDRLTVSLNILSERFGHVMYVPGNHEFYKSSFREVREILKNVNDNIHVLDRMVYVLSGVRFVGTTMWFPNDPLNAIYEKQLSDFHYIKDFRRHVYGENIHDQEFLKNNVGEGDIVITHHLPSHSLVSPGYAGSNLNRFYVCPMDDLVLERKPRIWCCGHTHGSIGAMIGSTRVIANPYGYYDHESNPKFNPSFHVEI